MRASVRTKTHEKISKDADDHAYVVAAEGDADRIVDRQDELLISLAPWKEYEYA